MILRQLYILSINLMPASVSREDFTHFIANKRKPILVKFTADWCNPCKKIKPVVNEHLKTLGDKIIYLENGEIKEVGTHQELINIDKGYYKKLFEYQFKESENLKKVI